MGATMNSGYGIRYLSQATIETCAPSSFSCAASSPAPSAPSPLRLTKSR